MLREKYMYGLDDRTFAALDRFARKNGRCWKAKLRDLWIRGKDDGALRIVRNKIGPSGLDRVRLPLERTGGSK